MQHVIIKKITTSLALLIITLPVTCLLCLQVQQMYVRYKMQEKLEVSLLQTICITEKDVQWIEPGKEIRIENKLFDVKHFHIENGKIFLTGLYDYEETFIENHLSDLATQSQPEGTTLVLFKLLHLLQTVFFTQIKSPDFLLIFSNPYYEYYYVPLLTSFKAILTPPPR